MAEQREIAIGEVALVRIPTTDRAYCALREQAHGLLAFAEARTVTTDLDVKPATEDLSIISKLKKAIEDKRKEYLTPLNDHVKTVNAAFKVLTEPLEKADKITRDKILGYRAEVERKRREAEDINRAKDELARREAALNQGVITVDTTPVIVPTAPPEHVRTDMGSLGTAKVWRFEVMDFTALPEEYKLPDLVKIGKVIRAGVAIAGVRAWQEESLRVTPTR